MADKVTQIAALEKYKAPGESVVKVDDLLVPNSVLSLPATDDPATYDNWGELFNTLTFPEITASFKEVRAFMADSFDKTNLVITKSNHTEYRSINNNLKTYGLKVGYANLTTVDKTKVYLHTFDVDGLPLAGDATLFLGSDLVGTGGALANAIADRITLTGGTLGPIDSSFASYLTLLIAVRSGTSYIPKLISIAKDKINLVATQYTNKVWSKTNDALSTNTTVPTGLNYPSAPINYGKWFDSVSGSEFVWVKSTTTGSVSKKVNTWRSDTETEALLQSNGSYNIEKVLINDILVLGVLEPFSDSTTGGAVNFNTFNQFPTPLSFFSFNLIYGLDKDFLDFKVKDYKEKEALFRKVHDEIQNRTLDSNKIKGEIDRTIRPYALKEQVEAGSTLLILEKFNNAVDGTNNTSCFANEVLANGLAYPSTSNLNGRKRIFSATILNNDLDTVWLHGKASEKLLKIGTLNAIASSTSEILSGFKVNGDFLVTNATTLSGILGVTGATTLGSTLAVTGATTLSGSLAVNSGTLTTSATTLNLFNSIETTVNFVGAATTFNLGITNTATSTSNLFTGATLSGATKTINLGTGGIAGSNTVINLGSALGNNTLTTKGAFGHTGTLSVNGAVTFASTFAVNNDVNFKKSVILGSLATDLVTVLGTTTFTPKVTFLGGAELTGGLLANTFTLNGALLTKGTNQFNLSAHTNVDFLADQDVRATRYVYGSKLKELDTNTGIEKFLGDIYQTKFHGASAPYSLAAPRGNHFVISKGATLSGSNVGIEPIGYDAGTWDAINKIYSNTNYKFGIALNDDFLRFKNDSFIIYPTLTSGVTNDFTLYTGFELGTQAAANTIYDFLKLSNVSESFKVCFKTNATNDNVTLLVFRNGIELADTITTWEATGLSKTAGEIFRDSTQLKKSIAFTVYNGTLKVVVGSEIVASYVYAGHTASLNTLKIGKIDNDALTTVVASIVLVPFTTSEFANYNGTDFEVNKAYNQVLQSAYGIFNVVKEVDKVEILSGKVDLGILDLSVTFKKNVTINGTLITSAGVTAPTGSFTSTLAVTGAATLGSTLAVTGDTTLTGNLYVNGGTLSSTASTFALLNTNIINLNAFSSVSSLVLGATAESTSVRLACGSTVAGSTKNLYLGTMGASSSTTNVYIGSSSGGNSNINTYGTLTHTGSLISSGSIRASAFMIPASTLTNGYGISLYGTNSGSGMYASGLSFAGTSTFGTHGTVTGDAATYFTTNNTTGRGWIYKNASSNVNIASIDNVGNATFDKQVKAESFNSGSATVKYNTTTKSLDFNFA